MTTKAIIEQLQLLIDKMGDPPKWSDRKESNGSSKTLEGKHAKLLECLSGGGDVTAMPREGCGNSSAVEWCQLSFQ